jgi:membrane-bound lytic murein transglycosylase B
MGVPFGVRRAHASLALALAAALAGSATAVTGSNAAASASAASTTSTSLAAAPSNAATMLTQATPASVTPVEATQPSSVAAVVYQPAIHIASSGPVVRDAVKVDIADILLRAYRDAADGAPASCHLPVSLLAAIGQVESGSLVGRPLDAEHRTSVLGPVLNGDGFAAIADTDRGRWDGSSRWDRAVGPMQFIPGTWRTFGVDGDGDGEANPQDVEDAAATTAAYLCYGGRDLARSADMRAAILSYNHSQAYLALVTTYQERYAALGLDADVPLAGLPTSFSSPNTVLPASRVRIGDAAGAAATSASPNPRPSHRPAKEAKPGPGTITGGSASPDTPTLNPSVPEPSPTPSPSPTPTPSPEPDQPVCATPATDTTTTDECPPCLPAEGTVEPVTPSDTSPSDVCDVTAVSPSTEP